MPLTLQELAGYVTKPPPMQFADTSSITQNEQFRQKLTDERQKMAEERAKAEFANRAAHEAEAGRLQRAQLKQGLSERKFGFEQEQAGQKRSEERRVVLETAYQKLREAEFNGDEEGVAYARQVIKRLGEEVTGLGDHSASPEAPAAPPAMAPPRSLPIAPGAPPSVGRPPPAPVMLAEQSAVPGSVTAGMGMMGRNPPPVMPGGPPGAPPPAPGPGSVGLPFATSFMAPEAGGSVTAGMAQNRPPQGMPTPPSPSPAPPGMAPPPAQAGPAIALPPPPGLPLVPRAPLGPVSVPPPPTSPSAPALTPPPASPEAPGGLQVVRNGAPVLSLSAAGGAKAQVEKALAPLVSAARTPQEIRAAKIAMQTAEAVVTREGIEKAREAGMNAYKFEIGQQTARDAAALRAQGQHGEEKYGGTGRTKAELDINDRDYKKVNDYIQKKSVASGLGEMGKNENGFRSVLVAAKSGTGTGQLAAVTKALKAMGNSGAMSDRDLERIMRSAGLWENFKNVVDQAESGTLPPALVQNVIAMAEQSLSSIQDRRDQIGAQAYDDMMANEFISEGGRKKAAEVARNYFSGAPHLEPTKKEEPAARPTAKLRGPKSAPAQASPKSADEFFFGR